MATMHLWQICAVNDRIDAALIDNHIALATLCFVECILHLLGSSIMYDIIFIIPSIILVSVGNHVSRAVHWAVDFCGLT